MSKESPLANVQTNGKEKELKWRMNRKDLKTLHSLLRLSSKG